MSTQIIERDGKPEYAVVPYETYTAMVERLEDLEDIWAADEGKAELARGEDELIPWELSQRLRDENPVRVWREYREVKQAELARSVDISPAALNKIENGRMQPSVKTLKALASALRLELDDLA